MEDYLASIIQQANYLLNVVGVDNLAPGAEDVMKDYIKSADSILDDACSMHNDIMAGVWVE